MKKLWIIALFFFITYLCFWHGYIKPFDLSDFFEAIDFISTSLTVLIFACILALLVSLIPFKHQGYGWKFRRLFPIGIIITCLVFGISFYSNTSYYNSLECSNCNRCLNVKDGKFKSRQMIIERNGKKQFQTDNGIRTEYAVSWISDCEYILTQNNRSARVKIVSVDEDGYDCYVLHNGRTSKKYRVDRMADDN